MKKCNALQNAQTEGKENVPKRPARKAAQEGKAKAAEAAAAPKKEKAPAEKEEAEPEEESEAEVCCNAITQYLTVKRIPMSI